VHKVSAAEVLLTSWQRVDDTHFRVTARWPRNHSLFAPLPHGRHGCHDPLIGTETIRQIGILLGHTEFGVPQGHQFAGLDLGIAVEPQHLRTQSAATALDIDVTCTDIRRRGAQLSGLRVNTVFHREGRVVARGGGSYRCLAPALYRRVRGEHALGGQLQPLPLPAPAAPQSMGRTSPMDVVLSPTGEKDRWRLRVDTRHPVFFDHPLDHVPGMLLMEAARQASAAALGRSSCLPLSIAGQFPRYTELDAPCEIEARLAAGTSPGGPQNVLVTGRQNGAVVFSCDVSAAAQMP
jgi:hypothetical protein